MPRLPLILALALVLSVSEIGAQNPPESPAEGAHRVEAIRRYEGLLAENNPALAGRRDELMFRLGILYLEDAQAAAPSGGVYGSRARYEQALSLFNQALSKRDSLFREDGLYYRAIAYEETGRSDPAMVDFKTLVREFPSSNRASEVWFRLGNDAVQKNRIGEALSAYQEVLKRGDPSYRDQSGYMYAWSAFTLRQSDTARTTLLDLLQRLEAGGQQQGNLYNESIELLAKVIRSQNSTAGLGGPWVGTRPAFLSAVLRRTADLFRETSAFREAAITYEQVLREYPDPASADTLEKLVIECYSKAREPDRAQEARERMIARHLSRGKLSSDAPPEMIGMLKDSALYLHQKARETKSPDLFRRAVAAYGTYADSLAAGPARAEATFFRAEALKEAGDRSGAAELYQTVAESRDPTRGEEAAFRRIALFEDARAAGGADVDGVLASYEEYFRLYPGGPHELELRSRQAGYLFDQKRYGDSLAAGSAAVARQGNPEERQKTKLLLARAAFANNDYAGSANWARQLLAEPNLAPAPRRDAEEIHAASMLKAAETLKDKPAEAALQYELLARTYPKHPSAPGALYNGATLLRGAGEKTRALSMLRTLLEQYPNADLARDATVAATDIYKETSDPGGAADLLERLAAREQGSPQSADLLYEAANRAREAGAMQRASEIYQRFLKASPGGDLRSANARIFLAKRFLASARDADAESMARETLTRLPARLPGEEGQKVQLIESEARLILGDVALHRFEALRIAEPLATTLKRKQAALEEAVRSFRDAASHGFADVSLASYYKMGYAQLDFATAVMQAPRPRNLTAEQRDQYDDLLRDQMRPYREQAEKAFRLTLEQAKASGIENEWTARARGLLGEFGGGTSRPAAAAPGANNPPPLLVPPPAS